jgi:cobalt-zinc-cadmium efflux system protein
VDGHPHSAAGDRRWLLAALCVVVAFMVAEVIAGLLAHSLALLADAGHMLTDAAALLLAVVAAHLAIRPARGAYTYGFARVDALSGQANGITLLLLAVWFAVEGVRRLIDPPEVEGGVVLVVALVGILVNLVATALLARASRQSINVRGAFVHVVNDLAAFVGTAVAGGLILATGWDRFDPIASLVVAGLIAWSSAGLLRESTRIFLESSPADIDPDEVGQAIAGAHDVVETHDLHVWTVTSGFPALSAHVLVRPGADCHAIRRRLERMLVERFGLDHTTLQVDHVQSRSAPVEFGRMSRPG